MSVCFGIKERKKSFFFGRERGWFSGEDIDLVKGGERNIEKVGFFGRDREKEEILNVRGSDFEEISSILEGYFSEEIQAAVLE